MRCQAPVLREFQSVEEEHETTCMRSLVVVVDRLGEQIRTSIARRRPCQLRNLKKSARALLHVFEAFYSVPSSSDDASACASQSWRFHPQLHDFGPVLMSFWRAAVATVLSATCHSVWVARCREHFFYRRFCATFREPTLSTGCVTQHTHATQTHHQDKRWKASDCCSSGMWIFGSLRHFFSSSVTMFHRWSSGKPRQTHEDQRRRRRQVDTHNS